MKILFAGHNHHFSLWAFVSVLGDDSLVSDVTGGWMDKTKHQINSFSYRLIAQWEPKVFLLRALVKLLIHLQSLEYGVPAHLALCRKTKGLLSVFYTTLSSSQPQQLAVFSRAVYKQQRMQWSHSIWIKPLMRLEYSAHLLWCGNY